MLKDNSHDKDFQFEIQNQNKDYRTNKFDIKLTNHKIIMNIFEIFYFIILIFLNFDQLESIVYLLQMSISNSPSYITSLDEKVTYFFNEGLSQKLSNIGETL